MIEIDGSMFSGSGTLLRYAAALATIKREPLHMVRIRFKRPKPGLRPQHLLAVKACCALSSGHVQGAEVGSQEIVYYPGKKLTGGNLDFDIGTAGSATMLAFTLIPPALFAEQPSRFSITGGLFQDFAPSFFHMQSVLLPLLRQMGAHVDLKMDRPGYVPKGEGRLTMKVRPLTRPLKPLHMLKQGTVKKIHGIALASHLAEQNVSRRMAERSSRILHERGYESEIRALDDNTAVQKGAALILWAKSNTGCLLGADQAGKPRRRSESIADSVARSLLEDLESGACTDRYLADQLILFAGLAERDTEYIIPKVTEHVRSNLWLVETILGVRTELKGLGVSIEGTGATP
jgi:RNA 3'-terminal phosphate cyclase (ATP)